MHPLVRRHGFVAGYVGMSVRLSHKFGVIELPPASWPGSKIMREKLSQRRHPRMLLSGVQSEFRLDSR